MGTLKPQSNGPLYSNTVINRPTLIVDGYRLLHLVQRGRAWAGAAAPPSPLLAVPNVTAHPSTANAPISYVIIRCSTVIASEF